jgi:hypothetical protein
VQFGAYRDRADEAISLRRGIASWQQTLATLAPGASAGVRIEGALYYVFYKIKGTHLGQKIIIEKEPTA